MSRKATIHVLAIALCMAILLSTPALGAADNKSRSASPAPEKLAEQVYDHLTKEYLAGQTGLDRLERIYNWSVQILQAEFVVRLEGLGRAEVMAGAMDGHVERMRKLEKQVAAMVRAGKASQIEFTAAQYFRGSVRHIEQRFEKMNQEAGRWAKEREMDIELPKLRKVSEAGALTRQPAALILNIDKEGNYHVAGKKHDMGQLAKLVKEYAAKNPGMAIIQVRADHQCRFEAVARALSICRAAGVKHCAIVAKEQPDKKK